MILFSPPHFLSRRCWRNAEHRASGEKKYYPANLAAGMDLRSLAATPISQASSPGRCCCPLSQHEITLGEEEIADVSLATFYVFDKENAGLSRHSERLACGCWTGTYYTRQ